MQTSAQTPETSEANQLEEKLQKSDQKQTPY